MNHLLRMPALLVCCATCSIAVAEEPMPVCEEALLFDAVGSGRSTLVSVYYPGTTGEQLAEFELFLMREGADDCAEDLDESNHWGHHARRRTVLHWQGIARGRIDDVSLRHALVNRDGPGLILTSDTLDPTPVDACDVDGTPGYILRETINVDESFQGFWDGFGVSRGRLIAHICFPEVLYPGGRLGIEILEGSYLCLSPDVDEPDGL